MLILIAIFVVLVIKLVWKRNGHTPPGKAQCRCHMHCHVTFPTESVFTAVFVSITVEGRGHHNRDTTYTYRFVNSSHVFGSVK